MSRRGWVMALTGVVIALMVGGSLWVNRAPAMPADARTVTVGVNPVAMAADPASGHVFVLSSGYGNFAGAVSVLDARTGRVVHTTALGHAAYRMAVASRARRLFVPNEMTGGLDVLDTGSGRFLGRVPVGLSSGVVVATRTERAFVSEWQTNKVATLDARTGRILRKTQVGVGPQAGVVDEAAGRVFVSYDGGSRGAPGISVLDARSGTLVKTIAGLAGQVSVNNRTGSVYVQQINMVRVLDGRTGALRQTFSLGSRPYIPFAVDERTGHLIVVNAPGGVVRVLDGANGRTLATTLLPAAPDGSYEVAADQPSGRAFVIGRGRAWVLDARTGRQARSIPMSGYIAADKRTGHIFIATAHEGRQINIGAGPVRLSFGSDAGSVTMLDDH